MSLSFHYFSWTTNQYKHLSHTINLHFLSEQAHLESESNTVTQLSSLDAASQEKDTQKSNESLSKGKILSLNKQTNKKRVTENKEKVIRASQPCRDKRSNTGLGWLQAGGEGGVWHGNLCLVKLSLFYESSILQLWQMVTSRTENIPLHLFFALPAFIFLLSLLQAVTVWRKLEMQWPGSPSHFCPPEEASCISFKLSVLWACFPLRELGSGQDLACYSALQHCFPVIYSSHSTNCASASPLNRHTFLWVVIEMDETHILQE